MLKLLKTFSNDIELEQHSLKFLCRVSSIRSLKSSGILRTAWIKEIEMTTLAIRTRQRTLANYLLSCANDIQVC